MAFSTPRLSIFLYVFLKCGRQAFVLFISIFIYNNWVWYSIFLAQIGTFP